MTPAARPAPASISTQRRDRSRAPRLAPPTKGCCATTASPASPAPASSSLPTSAPASSPTLPLLRGSLSPSSSSALKFSARFHSHHHPALDTGTFEIFHAEQPHSWVTETHLHKRFMARCPINRDFARPLFRIIGGIKPVKSLHSLLRVRNSIKHLKTGFILRPKAHMAEVRGCKRGHQTSWGYYPPFVQGKRIFTMTQFQNTNAQEKAGAWLGRNFPSSHSKQYSRSAHHKLVQHGSRKPQAPRDKQLRFFFPSSFSLHQTYQITNKTQTSICKRCTEISAKRYDLLLFKGRLICNWLQSGWAQISHDQV